MAIENKVSVIENQYNVKAVESEAADLYYLQDDDKKGLGILTFVDGSPQWVILSKKQALKLAEEIKDICDVVFDLDY